MIVAFCAVIAPASYILFMLTVLIAVRRPPAPHWVGEMLRWADSVQPWSMSEVMMLGILVALIKIAELATVEPGIGMYGVGGLIVLFAAIMVTFHPREVWQRIEWAEGSTPRVLQRRRRGSIAQHELQPQKDPERQSREAEGHGEFSLAKLTSGHESVLGDSSANFVFRRLAFALRGLRGEILHQSFAEPRKFSTIVIRRARRSYDVLINVRTFVWPELCAVPVSRAVLRGEKLFRRMLNGRRKICPGEETIKLIR